MEWWILLPRDPDPERRPTLRTSTAALTLSMLAACSAQDAGTLSPQEAARFLHQACGITFAQSPVVLTSTTAAASRRTTSVAVSATVVLPVTETEAALETLRNNRSLHSRGQSEYRYSYESFPGSGPETACELDTSLRVLYFLYVE